MVAHGPEDLEGSGNNTTNGTLHSDKFNASSSDKGENGKLENGGDSYSTSENDSWSVRLRKKISRRQLMTIIALAYGNFWIAACISLQAPFFPQEAENKGATATIYGFVFGVFELVIIIVSPFYAKMAKFVSWKVLVTFGVFVAGVCSVLFGFLDRVKGETLFISLAFVVRIAEGVGAAAFLTPCSIGVTSEFPENVAKAFSLVETFFGLGLIVGPTLGGALYEVGGFTLPFVVAGSFLLCGSLVSWYTLTRLLRSDGDTNLDDGPSDPRHTMFRFVANLDVILDALCIITALGFFGYNSATLEPHLREFSLGPFLTGLVFVVEGLVYALTTPLWGYLSDKGINSRLLCAIGCALTAVGQAFIGPFPFFPFDSSLWLIILSLAIAGLGDAAKLVCAFSNCLKLVLERGFPDNIATYGMVAAMFSVSCSIGAFIGPSIGGYLLDTIGYRSGTIVLFSVEVILMVALTVNLLWRRRRTHACAINDAQESESVQDEEKRLLPAATKEQVLCSSSEAVKSAGETHNYGSV